MVRLRVVRWCHYRGLCVSFCSRSTSMRILLFFPLSFPVTPSIFNALHVDWPGNPRQPISNGKHHVFQPLFLHFPTNSVYFSNFRSCASSIRSSQGTVSSIITHTLLSLENMTMSGRRFVGTISSGKRNCRFPIHFPIIILLTAWHTF